MERYRAQDFWTTEDREALAAVTLGVFDALPARDELVRRITESYVPRRHHRGAVSLLDDLADVLVEVSRGELDRDDERVRDVLHRAVLHVNGGRCE